MKLVAKHIQSIFFSFHLTMFCCRKLSKKFYRGCRRGEFPLFGWGCRALRFQELVSWMVWGLGHFGLINIFGDCLIYHIVINLKYLMVIHFWPSCCAFFAVVSIILSLMSWRILLLACFGLCRQCLVFSMNFVRNLCNLTTVLLVNVGRSPHSLCTILLICHLFNIGVTLRTIFVLSPAKLTFPCEASTKMAFFGRLLHNRTRGNFAGHSVHWPGHNVVKGTLGAL